MVQLSQYMTTGKTIALTIWTFAKVYFYQVDYLSSFHLKFFFWLFTLFFHLEHIPLLPHFVDFLCLFLCIDKMYISPNLNGVALWRRWTLSFNLFSFCCFSNCLSNCFRPRNAISLWQNSLMIKGLCDLHMPTGSGGKQFRGWSAYLSSFGRTSAWYRECDSHLPALAD